MSNIQFTAPKFPVVAKSLHSELKRRVNAYMEQHDIKSTGNYKLFSKAVILLSLFVVTYIHLVFFTPPTFYAIIECVFFWWINCCNWVQCDARWESWKF